MDFARAAHTVGVLAIKALIRLINPATGEAHQVPS